MIILLGSRAAALRDCLPLWRDGRVVDHDFYADAEGSSLIRNRLSVLFERVDVREKPTGWGAICDHQEAVDVLDFDPIAQAILSCNDNAQAEHLGVPVLVISEATQLAIKLGYRGRGFHATKNERDILWWHSRVRLGQEHEAVRLAMESKASRIWPAL